MEAVTISCPGKQFRQQLLHWAAAQAQAVVLDSCATDIDAYGCYDFLVGVSTVADRGLLHSLEDLEHALAQHPNVWRFGCLSYDLKSAIEPRLQSDLSAAISFPPLSFFEADVVISQRRDSADLVFECGYSEAIMAAILAQCIGQNVVEKFSVFKSNFTEAAYCAAVDRLREHIRLGDCYEINLSQNFTATAQLASPAAMWEALIAGSPVPFAGFGKWGDTFLLSASPERFLQLQGSCLRTQPIKGTAPRGADPAADAALAETLKASEKERAENVMIVDLSRNDLHRSCEVGSVQVPRLFEVQQFAQVHHLVSTIEGRKRAEVHPVEAIKHTFPPGSMTGAPKVRTCELIAQYEQCARGIYAGSLGYIAPGGDFDFNVVIRSLVYDATTSQLSYHVGGAITWDSDPQAEYAETLLKARAIGQLF